MVLFPLRTIYLPAMLLGLALLLFSACRSSKAPEAPTSDYLLWKQSGGMDNTPVFVLRVARSGEATYEGMQNTALDGKWQARCKTASFERVWRRVDSLNLADLPPYFPSSVQDAPNRTLVFSIKDQTKEVHYRTDPPAEIQELEIALRRLIRDEEWQASNQ
jgi:hypothetical protein